MSVCVHIDFETYSKADLKKVGAYRYAWDSSTRILLCSVAIDNEEPLIWLPENFLLCYGTRDLYDETAEVEKLLRKYVHNPDAYFYAHNAQFEIAISTCRMIRDIDIIPPKLSQWRCTAALARMAALPPSLDKASTVLRLKDKKDSTGKNLIRFFSIPKKDGSRNLPEENPDRFIQFAEYCKQDVRTERAVHNKLKSFDFKRSIKRTWELDKRLNHIGIPINRKALLNAKKIIDDTQKEYSERFKEITGLNPTQRDKVFQWFKSKGYPGKSLESAVMTEQLQNVDTWGDSTAKEALQLKSLLGYSAIKKVTTMLACDCGDEKVRGTLLFYGAGTGRWSGQLIQPQNFKRPSIKNTYQAYEMICNGCTKEDLQLMFGNPLEVIASCIRHFIQLPDDKLLDADFSSIEARIVCWLAGQEDALERFRKGVDSYIDMATTIFGKAHEYITKDERWMGKQTVLGCGFQMGSNRFYEQAYDTAKTFNIQGVSVTKDIADKAVTSFRRKYSKVRNLWYACDDAARAAIARPGKAFKAGPKLVFFVSKTMIPGVPVLVMVLPSGRYIVYPWPRIEFDKANRSMDRPKTAITFYGKLPMKQTWGRVKTYGGKLVENATQGLAADIMAHGANQALKQGFKLITLIHDEALAKHDNRTPEEFCKALTTLPHWCEDTLPVEAEGKIIPFYVKT